MDRRKFIKESTAAALIAAGLPSACGMGNESAFRLVDDFQRSDSLYHGDDWESLNPGYWQIEGHSLRRRLKNYGDRARRTGFPFHYETHKNTEMPVDYDPSLPHGTIYRRDWNLTGNYVCVAELTVGDRQLERRDSDSDDWEMYQPGYGWMGIAIGAKTQFDSYGIGNQALRLVYADNNKLELHPGRSGWKKGRNQRKSPVQTDLKRPLQAGDRITLTLAVTGAAGPVATLTGSLVDQHGQELATVSMSDVSRDLCEGWFGVVGRGNLDFQVDNVMLDPGKNQRLTASVNECLNCYALGTTLRQVEENWTVRFVSLFRNEGGRAEIRIADSEQPAGGWKSVPVAGTADVVSNDFRRCTAIIEATLPGNPADQTLYYTIWKDGVDVTTDVRIGTSATGPGTGLVGDVPATGSYVGRLPQLAAPYRLAGLSCHAINRNVQDPAGKGRPTGKDGSFEVRDQPTYDAYRHLEDYDMQVMVWEDDVWYMELLLYPPSTDDAWKIVNTTISGPTSRWQMMRHWNVINPGDHDYGMDDVKGPEQIAIRLKDGLGQDKDYMRRNFRIVHHLITGEEEVDPLVNPKKWRQWKMPNRDFSLLVVDSRLWRTSQDTRIWDDEGWGHLASLYDRADPTRTLLGEEQFGWLQEVIRTDSSPLICITGLNGLHTVWTGGKNYSKTDEEFAQRDRVAADYAGWVAAGSDRVIELLSSRDGVVSVYGDVHNGCILKNRDHRLYECSFGPIGRTGGRGVISGFGPEMKDFDGRSVTVKALYHKNYGDPQLSKITGPTYWNFLEMNFDPTTDDPSFELKIRNLVDAPDHEVRGGGQAMDVASKTGRVPSSQLSKELTLLPNADVHIATLNGHSLRGTRTDSSGKLIQTTLVDVAKNTQILVTANDGKTAEAIITRSV